MDLDLGFVNVSPAELNYCCNWAGLSLAIILSENKVVTCYITLQRVLLKLLYSAGIPHRKCQEFIGNIGLF